MDNIFGIICVACYSVSALSLRRRDNFPMVKHVCSQTNTEMVFSAQCYMNSFYVCNEHLSISMTSYLSIGITSGRDKMFSQYFFATPCNSTPNIAHHDVLLIRSNGKFVVYRHKSSVGYPYSSEGLK